MAFKKTLAQAAPSKANPAGESVKNTDKRVIAIGDIHGCALELETLLRKLTIDPDDTVVFLGDYIDRGPDAQRVIDIVLELSTKTHVVALKGNHESMFIDFLESPESHGAGLFVLNGGSPTLASYSGPGGSFEIPDSHIQFLYSLRLMYETPTHVFVHAGLPLKPLSEIDLKEDEMTLLWSRQPFLSSKYSWGKTVVHGHTPKETYEVKSNRINLDTGCVYGGALTALNLSTMEFTQVERIKSAQSPLYPRDRGNSRVAMRFTGRVTVMAHKAGQADRQYETLNYNQFGLLIREIGRASEPALNPGDRIEGRIGEIGAEMISFEGEVIRSESRNELVVYGVRLDRVTNGNDGREWIQRPSPGSEAQGDS